jgi:hypothetical protein
MDEEMLKQAKEVANNMRSITEISCPRDIKNPGLWFGFVLGWLAAKKAFSK